MASKRHAASAAPSLRLSGELTIFRAIELKASIMATPPPVEIDLAGITEIDTAGLQLLLLASRPARQEQRTLRLVAPSPAVTELVELLHLGDLFGAPGGDPSGDPCGAPCGDVVLSPVPQAPSATPAGIGA